MDTLIAPVRSLLLRLDEVATSLKPGDSPETPVRTAPLLDRSSGLETLLHADGALARKYLEFLITACLAESGPARAQRTA